MNDDFSNNNHKKSLREILPKGGARAYKRSSPIVEEVVETRLPEDNSIDSHMPNNNSTSILSSRRVPKMPKYLMWGIGLLFVLILFFIGSSFITKATAEVVPKQARINLDESVTAVLAATADELEFGTVSDSITEEVVVKASGTREVSEKAKGEIIIYNNYGSEPQTLVATTRFQTADGKIYRISSGVTVPGQKKEGGQTIPGSVVATVTADQPGAEYNIGLTDFKIPGFESSPELYSKFYARSKTPMTGGLVGTVSDISASDRTEAEARLKASLAKKATSQSQIPVPDGHILLKDSIFTSTSFKTTEGDKAGEAKVVGQLQSTGIVVTEERLATYLAKRYIPGYDDEKVALFDSSQVRISFDEDVIIDPATVTEIDMVLAGTAHLVWVINEDSLKEAIGGYNKSNFQLVIADFPMIESVRLKMMPPWARSIPEDPDKIIIKQIVQNGV